MSDVLSNANLPTPLYEAVWREVAPSNRSHGETVLWVGQPDAPRMTRAALPIVFFGVPWTLFAVVWTTLALRTSGIAFGLFGLPFVMIGCVMLAAPLYAGRKARQTVYVMTDQRILFVTASQKVSQVKNYLPQSPNDIERMEKTDGTGDLMFFRREGRDSDGDRTVEKVGFIGIPDVRNVEQILRDTFFNSRSATSQEAARLPTHAASFAAPWYTAHRG